MRREGGATVDAAAHEAKVAPKQQRRGGRARAIADVGIAITAEQRYTADAPYPAERDGVIGQAVSKSFPAQARSPNALARLTLPASRIFAGGPVRLQGCYGKATAAALCQHQHRKGYRRKRWRECVWWA